MANEKRPPSDTEDAIVGLPVSSSSGVAADEKDCGTKKATLKRKGITAEAIENFTELLP